MLLRLHQITDPSLVQERYKGCFCERGRRKKKQTLRDRKQETDHQEMETVCNGRVVLNVTL